MTLSRVQVFKIVCLNFPEHVSDSVTCHLKLSTVASLFKERIPLPHCTLNVLAQPW